MSESGVTEAKRTPPPLILEEEVSSPLLEKRKLEGSEIDGEDNEESFHITKRKCQFQLTPGRIRQSGQKPTLKNKADFVEGSVHQDINECLKLYESLSAQNEEIRDLGRKLESGTFNEEQVSHKFWNALHENYSSVIGYALGFLLILVLQYEWMIEEFGYTSEGHSVSKTLVILFMIYSYSFITIGLEVVLFVVLTLGIYYPKLSDRLLKLKTDIVQTGIMRRLESFKYFYGIVAGVWCMLTALLGTLIWNWLWWNHICKDHHDRSCRKSWLGRFTIAYRNKACYDPEYGVSSTMCEKLVSFGPLMIMTVIVVFFGNVMLPLINDYLALSYPPVRNLDLLCDIMDRLEMYDQTNQKDPEMKPDSTITTSKTLSPPPLLPPTSPSPEDYVSSEDLSSDSCSTNSSTSSDLEEMCHNMKDDGDSSFSLSEPDIDETKVSLDLENFPGENCNEKAKSLTVRDYLEESGSVGADPNGKATETE